METKQEVISTYFNIYLTLFIFTNDYGVRSHIARSDDGWMERLGDENFNVAFIKVWRSRRPQRPSLFQASLGGQLIVDSLHLTSCGNKCHISHYTECTNAEYRA